MSKDLNISFIKALSKSVITSLTLSKEDVTEILTDPKYLSNPDLIDKALYTAMKDKELRDKLIVPNPMYFDIYVNELCSESLTLRNLIFLIKNIDKLRRSKKDYAIFMDVLRDSKSYNRYWNDSLLFCILADINSSEELMKCKSDVTLMDVNLLWTAFTYRNDNVMARETLKLFFDTVTNPQNKRKLNVRVLSEYFHSFSRISERIYEETDILVDITDLIKKCFDEKYFTNRKDLNRLKKVAIEIEV